jgi:predicted TIM-barrel fold metal-dependent hydrolase
MTSADNRFADVPLFDVDNHIYEPIEALTQYLPANRRGAIEMVQVRGRSRIALRGQITDFIPNPTFEVVAAPGSHADYYAGNNPEGLSLREMGGAPIRLTDAMRWPDARLALMDEQGVERTIIYPTLANLVEFHTADDPDLTCDLMHGLNQWIDEVWQFNRGDRMYSAAVLSLGLVDRAVEELEWVLDRGAKTVLLRPAPVIGRHGSRAFSLPEFDPFWARVEEAGIAVCLHGSQPYGSHYAEQWEPRSNENFFSETPYRLMLMLYRDIQDTLAALICHGTFIRFPGLRIASVENGAHWVGDFFRTLQHSAKRYPKSYPVDPVEQFRQHVYINPFWEEDVAELVELCGADRVLYGSDYPHPEGLAEPRAFFEQLAPLDDALVRRIMYDNARELVDV